ncbi:BURP domain protein RD22-like [Vigna radiata var. radiata]|uniref:BURP domain protein RD22-like n=1 Tax=Vigna radiata var. radiata TaxID=3916 RepID=A0A3Q0EZW9_VIGRR|nr:BURP domain protein RD22-like [Vigna radiata var. radiata]
MTKRLKTWARPKESSITNYRTRIALILPISYAPATRNNHPRTSGQKLCIDFVQYWIVSVELPREGGVAVNHPFMPHTELDIIFKKRKFERPLLPRQIAQRIPFASAKIKEIFEMLSMKPEVENVKIVTETISLCEAPSIRGVEKNCATSLESMVDFITSKLGKNAQVISTEVEKVSKSEKFLVKDGGKILAEENIIVCHPMNYPYVVFYCHKISNITVRFMPLEGEDGSRVKAVAVCHKDTSEWDPNHGFLQALKVKPRTVPVCHILPEGDLLWFAK